ncbi:tail fiber protein [Microbacterium sp. LMI12-1-1.1]|uniref:tail fiber protein n=1 Tax=Microbacterium sp. LMI12-1-1.1 TaxID=3135225 RepID=UPI00342D5176
MAVTGGIWSPDDTSEYDPPVDLAAMALSIANRIAATMTPAGSIVAFGGAAAPTGWLLCQGQAVSRTTYADLFEALGTTYGAGDGSSTFNLPNLKGRSIVGVDSGQTEFTPLAKTGGAKTHKHTEGTLKAAIGAVDGNVGALGYQASNVSSRGPASTGSYTLGATPIGGNHSFNHYTPVYGETADAASLQPYIALNYIVKT